MAACTRPASAYSPNGNLLWSFQRHIPDNVFTPADIGSDGTHYFGQNLSQLFALNPNGSQRWHVHWHELRRRADR